MPTRIETVPQMDVAIQDMEHWVEELCTSHALSRPLCQRREQREAAHTSLQGVLAAWPRPSIEPRVLAVEGVVPKAVRAMQACISAGRGVDELLRPQPWQAVERALGADDGGGMGDGRAVPKQGSHAGGGGVPGGGGGRGGARGGGGRGGGGGGGRGGGAGGARRGGGGGGGAMSAPQAPL